MPFALSSSPNNSEISEAVNYLLANFGANLAADPNTGEITGPSGIVIAYLYKYLAIKYADSFDGSSGFSDSPTNKQYYGVNNSNSDVESTNPADYIWYKVAGGGFGTTNFLFYQVSGGRQINFFIGTAAPDAYYLQADSAAIDLDILTVPAGYQNALPTIYIWTANSTAPARPLTTSTYDWSTGAYSAPSGWSTTIPVNTTPGSYLWGISIPLTVEVTVTTSVLDWTDTAYLIYVVGSNGSNGSPGDEGPRSSTGYIYYQTARATAPSSPSASGYNFDTGSFSSLTSGWSTTFTAPAPVTNPSTEAGSKFWAVRYNVSEATYGGAQTVTLTAVFNWQNLDGLVTFTNVSAPSGTTFIDGGNIIANSLTVNKITSGTTSQINGGYFSLGDATTLNGFLGAGGFETATNGRFALLAFHEGTTNTAGAIGASALGASGNSAIFSVASYNTSYNSFYTATALNTGSNAVNGRYNRSIGTANNMALNPVAWGTIGSADNGGYFANLGSTASNRVTDVFLANTTTTSAGVFRRYDTTGSTLQKEIYLSNGSYSAQSTLGAIYSADGYLPFTGVHDGLIEVTEAPVVGDIVVDYQVQAVLDPSNIVMLYKKSSTANQKGVVGVCIQVFDTPPADWNEYEQTGELDPITGNPIPNPEPVPNPMYYPVPAGQKVIHINAIGEGTINVTGEGGDIEIGDLIVSSSTPGKGMKQSDDIVRNITVAKAREAVTFSSPSELKTVACIYLAG